MLDFSIILPTGQALTISLKSKELKGRCLLNSVFTSVKISEEERQYFGLKYSDKDDDTMSWLSSEANLKSMSFLSSSKHPSMQLAVRIFPKNPDFTLSTPNARNLFRHHMKNMLLSNNLGCDSKTHAMLDGFIAQFECGDYDESMKEYAKILNKFNVYAPSLLGAGTPIGETEYIKFVRSYHRKLRGVRPAQADILFLGMIQKVPMYGYKIYNVSDKINKNYHLALSSDGIHFMYESCIEIFTMPKRKETFAWSDLVFAELVRNKVKLGFFIDKGEFIERYIKVSGKYTIKSGTKFLEDLEWHKKCFLDVVDGTKSIVYDSRKKAQKVHSTKIPRRNSAFNQTVLDLRSSLRSSLRLNKKQKRRNASEDLAEAETLEEYEISSVRLNSE